MGVLERTDPPASAAGVELSPELRLEFNEAVQAPVGGPPANLAPQSQDSSATALTIHLNSADVRISSCSYCMLAGLARIQVAGPLQPETLYRLEVPKSALTDQSGNPWPCLVWPCPAAIRGKLGR